jgi:cell division protein FtsQ
MRAHQRARIALLGALVALPLLGGGWLWLRDSPLVAVEHVQIAGVAGPEARAIDAALTGAAHRMSTLDVRSGSLLAAVAPFRVVREVHAIASFPHRLSIRVVEQPPVAALTVGSSRSAVAADGVVLGPALLTSSLPTLSGGAAQPLVGRRLSNAGLLASLAVLGAAPAPLAKFVARAYAGPMGLTVAMRSGLLVYFGDATRPHAKWLSLARVLADPSSAGASYVDVRLPERPAAGFAAGVVPPADSAAGTAPTGGEQAGDEHAGASEESTVAALAAGLDQAGGVGTSTGTTSEPASAGGESAAQASPGGESAGSGGESTSSGATPAGQAGAATSEPAAGAGAPSGEGTQAGVGGGAPAAGG